MAPPHGRSPHLRPVSPTVRPLRNAYAIRPPHPISDTLDRPQPQRTSETRKQSLSAIDLFHHPTSHLLQDDRSQDTYNLYPPPQLPRKIALPAQPKCNCISCLPRIPATTNTSKMSFLGSECDKIKTTGQKCPALDQSKVRFGY